MNKTNIEYLEGKTHISSHGYIKVYIGRKDPRSDVSGFAYRHRLVAEKKLGRPLKENEVVHHLDGDKTNDDPVNIIINSSLGEHRTYHRKPDSNLQKIGESNSLAMCTCGCGSTFLKYDKNGRPRKYISGHNPQYRGKHGRYQNTVGG